MKGYVYVDVDGFLYQKSYDYIKNVNPGFFGENMEYMIKHWYFDTDDRSTLVTMLKQMQDLEIRPDIVASFRAEIGIPAGATKTNEQ